MKSCPQLPGKSISDRCSHTAFTYLNKQCEVAWRCTHPLKHNDNLEIPLICGLRPGHRKCFPHSVCQELDSLYSVFFAEWNSSSTLTPLKLCHSPWRTEEPAPRSPKDVRTRNVRTEKSRQMSLQAAKSRGGQNNLYRGQPHETGDFQWLRFWSSKGIGNSFTSYLYQKKRKN